MGLIRSDLPLAGDSSARFLPWIIGCMVYLAALALAATMAADRLADRWRADLVGTFSVQIPPDASTTDVERERLLGEVADAVAAMDGVASVRIIGEAEKLKLLEPWLGAAGLPEGVRLPDIVVMQMRADAVPDAAVRQQILLRRDTLHLEFADLIEDIKGEKTARDDGTLGLFTRAKLWMQDKKLLALAHYADSKWMERVNGLSQRLTELFTPAKPIQPA